MDDFREGDKGTLLLFGPQLTTWDAVRLTSLRKAISVEPDLQFLSSIVKSLCHVWRDEISNSCPGLVRGLIDAESTLHRLHALLETEDDGIALGPDSPTPNILLVPLTVVAQIVEFVRLQRRGRVQGFCVGFLAASVVAASQSQSDFQQRTDAAIRLAVCIGAAVDLDEKQRSAGDTELDNLSSTWSIRWTSTTQKERLDDLLASFPGVYISCVTDVDRVTVTIMEHEVAAFVRQLADVGLVAQSVGVCGRYHKSDPGRVEIVDQLRALTKANNRFRLPASEEALSSLRSPIDTRPIADAALHDVALESILLRTCDWYGTVREALREYDDATVDIITIGGVQGTLPRSLRSYGRGSHHAAAIDYKDNDMSSKDGSPANPTPDESLSAVSDFSTQPIAVIGIGCRYAQADSLEEFWSLINSGRNAATEVPPDRFRSDELWRSPKGPFYGNFVSEPDAFDHRFFNISAREAASMDPQQRLLLQVAYEAMESAGCPDGAERPGEAIGCYIGCSYVEYEDNVASQDATAFSATGTIRAFVSGKVSHHFGWTGPSICFDTACSSSAVAIHQACRALQTNDCSVAIAGGVNMISSATFYQNLAAASFLNNTGASRAFDAGANGYCRGEGAGVLVLKPLRQAIRDGDRILGTVIGSAVNQGSSCTPITVPDSGSQSSLYKRTLTASGTPASQVTYVEAHGTGTPVGDPIECASIRAAFGSPERDAELVIGSVKDVIGHTEAASGVAGVIKTLLMMQHGSIPKQPNFTRLNPKIPSLEPDNLTIASRPRAWSSSGPRTALVNNYGAAGSNAAILLEEYTASTTDASPAIALQQNPGIEYPVTLLARTEESLAAYCGRLKDYLDRHGSVTLPDLAFSLARRQNWTLDYSTSFSICDIAALQQGLAAVASGVKPINQRNKRYSSKAKQPVVLCFGGQSGRSVYLSEDLVRYSPALKRRLDECDNACRASGLPGLFPRIYDATPVQDLVQLHAMLFAIQYSSAMAWKDAGVEIACMIGHSFGQLTALAVAGCMTLSEGMSLVTKRASLMQSSWGPDTGAMLAVEGELDVLQILLDTLEGTRQAEVACYNGPNNIVLAFESAALDDVERLCKLTLGLKTARLANSHAYHSSLTSPILKGLEQEAESINWQTPSTPFETCSTGKSWSHVSADKIAQHTRTPVYFGEAVQRITDRLGPCMWLEAGSCSPITSLIRRALPKSERSEDTGLAAIDLGRNSYWQSIAQATSALWTAGYQVSPLPLAGFPTHTFAWLDLPPYQFAKTKHWIRWQPVPEALKTVHEASVAAPNPPPQLLRRISDQNTDAVFVVDPNDKVFDLSVRGHAVVGQSLVPAGLYFELAIRAAVSVKSPGNEQIPSIQQLRIFSPLGLTPEGGLFVSLAANSQFTIFSCPVDAAGNPSEEKKRIVHASGVVSLLEEYTVQNRLQTFSRLIGSSRYSDINANSIANRLSGDILYTVFSQVVKYAPYYKGLRNAVASNGEAIGDVVMPQGKEVDCISSCMSDPLAVDSFLQLAGVHINFLRGDRDHKFVRVCNGIGQVAWSSAFLKASEARDDSPSKSWRLYSHMETASETTTIHDVFVLDIVTGAVVLAILGAEFVEVRMDSLQRLLSHLNKDITTPSPVIVQPQILAAVKEPTRTIAQEKDQTPAETAGVPYLTPSQGTNAPSTDGPDISQDVKDMLGDFLGLDASEIMEATDLADLGVDSLMIIELAADVQKRFFVQLSTDDLQQLTDVQSLIECVGGPSQAASMTQEASTPGFSEGTRSSTEGTLVDGDAANGTNDNDDGIAILASAWLARNRCSFEEDAQASGFAGFHELVYPAQAELVVAYTVEALAALGCDLRKVRPGQRLPKPSSSPKHDKLMKQMFCILEDAGLAVTDGSRHTRANGTLPSAATHDLHASIVQKFPQHAKEHELLRLTGARLADCLTGRADGLKLMFGSAESRRLMEDVYTDGPMFKAATSFLARFLGQSILQYRGQREIRILELGGGTGGTTVFLLKQLFENAALPKIRYTFSDVSGSLVAAARKKFSHYSFVDYAIVNIEQDPVAELLGRFDIVISTNCVHATPSLSRSSRNIGKMLREDGMLCLVEHTKNLYWFDLVWGLVEGWWLFDDGRTHPLASEGRWMNDLQASGFSWVDWSDGPNEDSRTVRVIAASKSRQVVGQQTVDHLQEAVLKGALPLEETITYKTAGSLALQADVFYPPTLQNHGKPQPVALMIHGGGHVMLSRKDVRPKQTQMLLDAGFVPISIDYRLCPEVTLLEGPMEDAQDALAWARHTLPHIARARPDVRIDGTRVFAIGWSTGGTLALSLGWAARVQPPEATLVFYCPYDYDDPAWSRQNKPYGDAALSPEDYDVWESVADSPMTAYNPAPAARAAGGWASKTDARSRIVLHMNWYGQTVPVLVYGLKKPQQTKPSPSALLPPPTSAQISAISPLAQVRQGNYRTPTFIIHPVDDDLIPWQQAQRMTDELARMGVEVHLRLIDNAVHLFDILPRFDRHAQAAAAVKEGYAFLSRHAAQQSSSWKHRS